LALRSFPIVYAGDVGTTATFYARLGFTESFRLPEEGAPGYIGMTREGGDLAVVSTDWPRDHYGLDAGDKPRFELFVYVDDVQATFDALRAAGVAVIKPPEVMPWGETVAFVTDPDGNPVALAQ
jgi:lactoylglutathione lyase